MRTLSIIYFFSQIISPVNAQELDCDETPSIATKLQEKIAKPISQFKYKGYISPQELQSLSSRDIAERLVQQMSLQCDEVRASNSGPSLMNEAKLYMAVPSEALDSISKHGFQNQHNTRTSKGSNDRVQRLTEEGQMSGMALGYGPKAKEILPKYSFIDFSSFDFVMDGDASKQYGDVIFSFKEDVKKEQAGLTMIL